MVRILTPAEASPYPHKAALFGPDGGGVSGEVAFPPAGGEDGCAASPHTLVGRVLVVERGGCPFVDKVLLAEDADAEAVVVCEAEGADDPERMWRMVLPKGYGDGARRPRVPAVFVRRSLRDHLVQLQRTGGVRLEVGADGAVAVPEYGDQTLVGPDTGPLTFLLLAVTVLMCCGIVLLNVVRRHRRRQRAAMRREQLDQIGVVRFGAGAAGGGVPPGPEASEEEIRLFREEVVAQRCEGRQYGGGAEVRNEECSVCLAAFEPDEELTVLPCGHAYHAACIGPWIRDYSERCPTCRHSILDEHEDERAGHEAGDDGGGSGTEMVPLRGGGPSVVVI